MENKKLPKDWKFVKFGDVVKHVKNKIPDRDNWDVDVYVAGEHIDEREIRVTKSAPIKGNELVIGSAFKTRFKPGQVLYVTRRAYLRKAGLVDFDGICSDVTFTLEPKDNSLLGPLLPFIMQTESFTKHATDNSHGSTNPFLNWKDIASYDLILPSKKDQKKISEILWGIEDNLDKGHFYYDLLKKFERKIMNKLVKNNNGDKQRLGKHIDIIRGASYASKDYTSQKEGNPFINLACINRGGGFNKKGLKYFKGSYKEEQIANLGDILVSNVDITRNADVLGYPLIVPNKNGKDFIFSMDLCKLQIKEDSKLTKDYLFHILRSKEVHNFIVSRSGGSTVLHLQVSAVKKIEFNLPDKDEQKKIVNVLDKIDFQLKEVETYLKSLKDLRQKLMNELLLGNLRLK
jgi:type I restriction enzyme, S subunit